MVHISCVIMVAAALLCSYCTTEYTAVCGFCRDKLQDHIENKERMDAELARLKSEIDTMKMEFDHKLM